MSLLNETYIFYVDIYFIQNFIIKAVVIYLALYCNKFQLILDSVKGIGKIIVASIFGTLFEMTGLMLGISYNVVLVLVHLLEIPCMIRFVIGKECTKIFKVIITGYFFVIVINGILEIIWNSFGGVGNYILWIIVACAVAYVGTRMFRNYSQMQKGIFPVELQQEKSIVQTCGLYDTGNHLHDPQTGEGVHIISENIKQRLFLKDEKENYIPYQSLGNEEGLIRIYYVECIRVQKGDKWIEKKNAPIGVAQETLFIDKKYQMILNEDIV